MAWLVLLLLCCFSVANAKKNGKCASLLNLRGGWVPQAGESDGDYYDQFHLDYDCDDNIRQAGALKGLVKSGKVAGLQQSDPFLKWLCEHLETGPEATTNQRIKPFHVADFGRKADLKKGEHPKIIIVNRKLKANSENGQLEQVAPDAFDVEERVLWQPWLRAKCDFVVRYVVPDRVNICRIMEQKRRFRSELELRGPKEALVRMIFRPSVLDRLKGKKDVVITHPLDASKLH
eukprot:gene4875-5343_t